MLTLTYPHETWAHRLPAGVKLVALGLWTAALFAVDSLPPIAAATAALTCLILTCGPAFAATSARMLRPLWPFVLIVALWQVALGDASLGVVPILRLITAVAAANVVTMTTRLADLIATLTWAARPLAILGLPPRVLALSIALMIRFLPVMLTNAATLRDAFRARSARRPGWRLLVPLILATLDDADHVAQALQARGGAG